MTRPNDPVALAAQGRLVSLPYPRRNDKTAPAGDPQDDIPFLPLVLSTAWAMDAALEDGHTITLDDGIALLEQINEMGRLPAQCLDPDIVREYEQHGRTAPNTTSHFTAAIRATHAAFSRTHAKNSG